MAGYRIDLEPDDNDTVLVTCPALPEVNTFAESREEAPIHASDAIEEALAARIADGRDVPDLEPGGTGTPDFAALPTLTATKVHLYRALRESGRTRADLMRALGWKRESVDRLFRLDHASRHDQLDEAFRALGLRVGVTVESVPA